MKTDLDPRRGCTFDGSENVHGEAAVICIILNRLTDKYLPLLI